MYVSFNQVWFDKCFSFFLLVFILGCQDSTKRVPTSGEESIEVTIDQSAGEKYIVNERAEEAPSYLPLPFNLGYIRGLESEKTRCVILSQRLDKRSRLAVTPIALFSMKEYGVDINYIIVVPEAKDLKTIPISSFSDLTTKYISIKNIIENWMLHRCGFNCSENKGWGGASAAFKKIENLNADQ